jgi:hypothetical protein
MERTVAALMLSSIVLIVPALLPAAAQQNDITQSVSTARFQRKGFRAIANPYTSFSTTTPSAGSAMRRPTQA